MAQKVCILNFYSISFSLEMREFSVLHHEEPIKGLSKRYNSFISAQYMRDWKAVFVICKCLPHIYCIYCTLLLMVFKMNSLDIIVSSYILGKA